MTPRNFSIRSFRKGGLRRWLERYERVLVVTYQGKLLLARRNEEGVVTLAWGSVRRPFTVGKMPYNVFMREIEGLSGKASVAAVLEHLTTDMVTTSSSTFREVCLNEMGISPEELRSVLRPK